MRQITEKDELQKEWYEEAKGMTLEKLPSFLKKLTEEYGHDYGTICHAMAAGGIATMWAINKSPSGGITVFQGGCVMWEFIRNWNYQYNKTNLKLIDYDNFLYPQYESQYDKTLSKEVWGLIQKDALYKINEADAKYEKYLVDLAEYEKLLTQFVVKYPDYQSHKEYYNHLGIGTGNEREAYEKKKESGFEFAPKKPYEPVTKDSRVYKHWESVVNGIVPFGYAVEKENN